MNLHARLKRLEERTGPDVDNRTADALVAFIGSVPESAALLMKALLSQDAAPSGPPLTVGDIDWSKVVPSNANEQAIKDYFARRTAEPSRGARK
jgi:hypothetical protein